MLFQNIFPLNLMDHFLLGENPNLQANDDNGTSLNMIDYEDF
jgi:hypothetical protein